MRRCTLLAAAAASAGPVNALKYDVVVIGSGVAGSLVAGKLGMDNLKTLVLEEGVDIRTKPDWHWTLPSSLLAHRMAKRGYEATDTFTTPQKSLTVNMAGAPSAEAAASTSASAAPHVKQNEAASSQRGSSSDSSSGTASVLIPTARVLGGQGVMGSRTWNLGSGEDWKGSPWDFREDLLPRVRAMENREVFVPHRGKRGRFLVCTPRTFSPYYKPFCEAASQNVPLISEFTKSSFAVEVGVGRPDSFIDQTTGKAHSTLQRYLLDTIKLQRPVRVECGAKVVGIRATPGSKGTAAGVTYTKADGQLVDVDASIIIVAAGTVGSARLLHASRGALDVEAGVGSNFWDIPQVTLQYRTKDRSSHNCYSDPLVRSVVRASLRLRGSPELSLRSSWDDMICYWGKDARQAPEAEILFQPFTLNSDGTQPLQGEHGCQFVIRPLRPKSRGVIGVDGSIDPKYFTEADDLARLQSAVDFVKQTVVTHPSLQKLIGAQVGERMESSGVNGGSCFNVIDPSTFRVKNMANVYACGNCVLPHPLIGSTLPYTMVLAEKFVDTLLKKKEVRDTVADDPSAGATRIVY